SLVRTYHEYD
ncbi:hypothetical protein CP8484711_1805B, partial [Chlamydia psittaci 84-8471/1]